MVTAVVYIYEHGARMCTSPRYFLHSKCLVHLYAAERKSKKAVVKRRVLNNSVDDPSFHSKLRTLRHLDAKHRGIESIDNLNMDRIAPPWT